MPCAPARAPEGHSLEPDSSELTDSFIHFFSKCLWGTSWVPRPRLAYELGEPYLEAWPLEMHGCLPTPKSWAQSSFATISPPTLGPAEQLPRGLGAGLAGGGAPS